MKIGLQIPRFTYPGGAATIRPVLKDIAQAVEAGGFYSLWTMDHFFQMEMIGGPYLDMMEGYSTLSYFAALTEKVKLGTLVTGVIYRHPGILIKTVTTLDTLSGGRAYLGIGAAWYEREARGLGVPYPSTKDRFEQLEETLQIAHQMWSGAESKPFAGTHFQLAEALNLPNAISKPHPPILIGGGGEQKTLRLVARYADACNLFAQMGTQGLVHKLDILKQHCDEVGRDYAEIEKTAIGTLDYSKTNSTEVIAFCRELAGIGIQHVIFSTTESHDIGVIEKLGLEVIPEVAGF